MFDRGQFLGQVPLRGMGQPFFAGPSGTPFFGYPASVPSGYFANPQGGPLMTEELTSPQEEHIEREFHCYRAPASDPNDPKSYRSIPFGMRDAYLAAGWVAVPYENCGPAQGAPPSAAPVGAASFFAPSRIAGKGMGARGGGGGGGIVGGAIPVAGGAFPTFGSPFINPYGYPGATRTVCTMVKDAAGNDVEECHEEPASGYPVSYPVVSYPGLIGW